MLTSNIVSSQNIRSVVAEILEVSQHELHHDLDLQSLESFDSVNALVLMLAFDEKLGIKLEPGDMQKLRYYRDFEDAVKNKGFALTK